jgi:anti-sigma B factor antagonist
MRMPLRIDVNPGQRVGEVVLSLSGPLVMDSLFDFQKTWRAQTAPNILVDLTNVPYLDSSGIGSLVNMHVSREKIGGSVHLLGVCERVKTELMVTKVDRILNITPAPSKAA